MSVLTRAAVGGGRLTGGVRRSCELPRTVGGDGGGGPDLTFELQINVDPAVRHLGQERLSVRRQILNSLSFAYYLY